MKKIFFTVGPSQIYPTIPSHIQKAIKDDILSISHRSQEFRDIYKAVVVGLKKLLNIPSSYQIVFVSSALEAMERVLQGMSHNNANNSFHIISGFFGKTWMDIAKGLGKSPGCYQFFDWENNLISKTPLEKIKIPKEADLVCITQNDTSVGFCLPMGQIYKLRQKYPEKLFALDVVSAVPFIDIEYKFLDAIFFSVQKGFGLPAGLGVLILSPKAVKQAQKLSKLKGYSIGSYHSLVKLVEKGRDFQTNETPNVLGIYLLGSVVNDFLKIGINKIRKKTEQKAQMLYSFFSKPEYYWVYVKNPEYQSKTTPVFEIKGGSEAIRKFAADYGLILGAGYKQFKNKHVRIANFPAQSIEDVKKLIYILGKYQKNILRFRH